MRKQITAQTTLGELALEKGKLGIEVLAVAQREDGTIHCSAHCMYGAKVGHGATLAEALDEVFNNIAKLTHESLARSLS
jgi:hypothetical protein